MEAVAIIGLVQAVVAVLLWFGMDAKALGKWIAMPAVAQHSKIILLFLLGSVAFSSYALYQATRAPAGPSAAPPALPPIIRGWGSEPPVCAAIIDAARLMSFRDKYNVAMACGFNDPTVDRFQDRRITISSAFIIRPGTIHIAAQYSDEMGKALEKQKEQARKASQKFVTLSTWYEIILVPKGIDLSSIYRLSDVATHDGKVISQHFPEL